MFETLYSKMLTRTPTSCQRWGIEHISVSRCQRYSLMLIKILIKPKRRKRLEICDRPPDSSVNQQPPIVPGHLLSKDKIRSVGFCSIFISWALINISQCEIRIGKMCSWTNQKRGFPCHLKKLWHLWISLELSVTHAINCPVSIVRLIARVLYKR